MVFPRGLTEATLLHLNSGGWGPYWKMKVVEDIRVGIKHLGSPPRPATGPSDSTSLDPTNSRSKIFRKKFQKVPKSIS